MNQRPRARSRIRRSRNRKRNAATYVNVPGTMRVSTLRMSPKAALLHRVTRRSFIGGAASIAFGVPAGAAQSPAFSRWVAGFRSRAIDRGISEQTYDRVMGGVTPDTSV